MDKIGLEYYNAALLALQGFSSEGPEDNQDPAAKLEEYLTARLQDRSAFV
jgi:hypothetical protein